MPHFVTSSSNLVTPQGHPPEYLSNHQSSNQYPGDYQYISPHNPTLQNNGNYYPPIQFENPSLNHQQSELRIELYSQIKELEGKLEKGWYHAFKIWLWGYWIFLGFSLIFLGGVLCYNLFSKGNRLLALICLQVILWEILWLFCFCWKIIKALSELKMIYLKEGLFAWKIIAISYVPFLLGFYTLCNWMEVSSFEGYNYYIRDLTFCYLIPMAINFKGAKEIRKVLENRQKLIDQI